MATRESKSISFTPQQSEFVDGCVASGRYQSSSEVVREAIRLLEHQEELRQAEITSRLKQGMENYGKGKDQDAKSALRDIASDLNLEMS